MVLMHRKICVGHRGFLDVDVINMKGVKRMAEIDKRLVYGKLHIYPASRSVYKNDQEVELIFNALYFSGFLLSPDFYIETFRLWPPVSSLLILLNMLPMH